MIVEPERSGISFDSLSLPAHFAHSPYRKMNWSILHSIICSKLFLPQHNAGASAGSWQFRPSIVFILFPTLWQFSNFMLPAPARFNGQMSVFSRLPKPFATIDWKTSSAWRYFGKRHNFYYHHKWCELRPGWSAGHQGDGGLSGVKSIMKSCSFSRGERRAGW